MKEAGDKTLYISRITLRNIRCFREDLVIDLTQPSHDKPSWTLILGDNGTGKTTILRCIAMCLCDETSASGLLTELTGDVIRHGCKDASIELRLKSSSHPPIKSTITTTLTKTESGTEELKQAIQRDESFPGDQVFACGYGAAYGTIGSEVHRTYRPLYSHLSLFDYTARLWNPENALFRISRDGIDLDELLARIDRILMLPPKSTRLDSSGLQIKGPWGEFVPAGALGDGYAATLSWICDLLGWSLLAKRASFDVGLRGIVLLDEMEQHLHPSWQRAIIRLLAAEFPGFQFIATTHSPMLAGSLADLPDGTAHLEHLSFAEDESVVGKTIDTLAGWRYDQILTSEAFGLAVARNETTTALMERLRERYTKGLDTPEQRAEFERGLEELRKLSVTAAEDERQRGVQVRLASRLEDIQKLLEGQGGDTEK